MRYLRPRIFVSLALIVVALLAAGCIPDKVDVGDATRQTIDTAIDKLTNESADWRTVLEEARKNLPKEAQSFVRVELNNLISRSIAAAGSEVRCIVDFMGQRVLEGLLRLRAQLLGQEVPPRQPIVCNVTASPIRMAERNQDPSRFAAVEVFGYNFDTQPAMQVLLTDNNVVRDVTKTGDVPNLTYQSHYQMTLNLGANGIRLSATSQLIAVAWNGTRLTEIPVIQPEQSQCETKPFTVRGYDIGMQEVRARLERGDPEFGTNQPWVTAGITLSNRETHVDAEVWIQAWEANNGDTVGSGRSVFSIYSAPTGWRVLRIVTPSSDTVPAYHDTTWEMDSFPRAGNGPVSAFYLWGDTPGWDVEPDRDDGTRVRAQFRDVQLEIVKTVDCR